MVWPKLAHAPASLLNKTHDKLITKQIDQTAALRQKCIDDMIRYIEEDVAEAQAQGESGEIKVAHYLFLMTFNLIGNLVLSRDLVNPRSKDGHEFHEQCHEVGWDTKCGRILNIFEMAGSSGDHEEHGAGHGTNHEDSGEICEGEDRGVEATEKKDTTS